MFLVSIPYEATIMGTLYHVFLRVVEYLVSFKDVKQKIKCICWWLRFEWL